ncbi:MAG: GtrA family protein [Defluviitaleaceae bacterium]|nr:GtrA family protein [Defluviitaleaceae bacterium]
MRKYLNRETVSYLTVGICTTTLAWGLFALLSHSGLGTVAANNVANAAAVLFAFAANKIIVFRSSSWAAKKVLPEMLKFFAARLLTHVLETAALYILVDVWELPAFIMKGLTMCFIQVLGNYALGKWVVFVKK